MNSKLHLRRGAVIFVFIAALFISWTGKPDNLEVPVDYYKLDNGLKVVLSPDKTSPIISVGVYYHCLYLAKEKKTPGYKTDQIVKLPALDFDSH